MLAPEARKASQRQFRDREKYMEQSRDSLGTLFVVATPIGNLDDLSPRMTQVLQDVDLVASEDTRTVGVFLARIGVDTKQTSFFEGNEVKKTAEILDVLRRGESVALVCEAGTPGVSDPGAHLVSAAAREGFSVVPISGPCAAVTALSASGLPTRRFLFEGFLPKTKGRLHKRLEKLSSLEVTLVFYESPKRLGQTLAEMVKVWGVGRKAVVARELTKLYEEFIREDLGSLAQRFSQKPPRGEVTLLIEGAKAEEKWSGERLDEVICEALASKEQPPSRMAKSLARKSGWKRQEVYNRVLELSKKNQ